MTVTSEPFGLRWLNNANPNALGIAVSQVVWLFGSGVLTWADRALLLSGNGAARESGIVLAGMLLGAWTGKSIVGAVDAQNKRKLHPDAAPALEATERGKVAGAAAAVVLAEKAADMRQTREQVAPAAPVAAAVTVTARDQSTVEVGTPAPAPLTGDAVLEQEWATGNAREGVL